MSAPRVLAAVWALVALLTTAAEGGTFFLITSKIRDADPTVPGNVGPYAIVHPPGYSGQAGTFTVRLCVRPGSEALIPALDWAIGVWNRRLPKTRNCPDCLTYEDVESGTPHPGATFNIASVLLHELGHCAVGLGHPNHHEVIENRPDAIFRTGTCDVDSDASCGDASSFTDSGMTTEILVGADGIRGTRDDDPLNQCGFIASILDDPDASSRQVCEDAAAANPLELAPAAACIGSQCCPPCPGPACPTLPMQVQDLAWFRKADNNPVIVDGVVIDRNSFSRSTSQLPAGSAYAANANRLAAAALGYPDTQAVMYSALGMGQGFNGLVADDVNMVRMGMTGVDRLAPNVDDYTLVLERVADCVQAVVEVYNEPTLPLGTLGECVASIAPSPGVDPVGGLLLHYTVTASGSNSKPLIRMTTTMAIDHLIPLPSIGFETGDASEWSDSAP